MKKSRLPVHRHENGHWCHCPFGNKEPYVAPRDREAYGSKTAFWVTADKLNDFLRPRPDLQTPEHQRFLDRLELAYPDHDHLYPWLVRERKKGRVVDPHESAMGRRFPLTHDFNGDQNAERMFTHPLHFHDINGRKRNLDPDTLDQITDWMKYQKQAGKGVDIMKHEIGPAADAAQKADIGGEVVHQFDNGYNIVKLRNRRDMVTEGQRMYHCVGSPQMGYIAKNDNGDGLFYSLRDSDNDPYGTAEVQKSKDEYYRCPHCKKFNFGTWSYDPETGRNEHVCENCGKSLYNDEGELDSFPLSLKDKTHPDSKYTDIAQMFGPHDNKMDDYHEQMFNEYFGQHGHPYYESDGNDPDEEEEEEEYEPWWNDYYYVPGATTAQEYMDHASGEHYDYAPDQYQRAMADADEHGLEGPELEIERPDFDDVFNDLQNYGDPETINNIFQMAKHEGHLDEFAERAHDWLTQEYEPYLDPYGQGGGMFPSQHYPEDNEDEKYFARNLMYQLDKHYPADPQTGERAYKQTLNRLYPSLYPREQEPGYRPPTFSDPSVPITEQTGPLVLGENHNWHNLPYGRGEQVNHDPTPGVDNPLPMAISPSAYPRYPRQVQEDPVMPFSPAGLPSTPEGYFTPGQETTERHQRPIPGMQWEDTHGLGNDPTHPIVPTRPNAPFNPNEPYVYPEGQQQGEFFPPRWYIDFEKQHARQTELPEELFQPHKYGFHHRWDAQWGRGDQSYGGSPQQDGQVPLWESAEDPNSFINTQQPFHTLSPNPNSPYISPSDRPRGQWQAKTAGPWTHNEQKGGKPRPKPDYDEGFGIYGVPVHTGKPHLNGRIIEHTNPDPFTMPGFQWRRPVVYDKKEDRLYVGQPGMEHADMMKHFHKPNPWGKNFMADGDFLPGLIDIDGNVEGGGLSFYKSGEIPNEEEFHDWVEGQHGVRSQDSKYQDPLEDLSWSPDDDTLNVRDAKTYHPTQDEEWVAEDEPVFSAIIPEGRWRL